MRTRAEAVERMRFLEAVLPARARDTRRLEAELRHLSMTLTDRTHNAMCEALEDAMPGSPEAGPAGSADTHRNTALAALTAYTGAGNNSDNDPLLGAVDAGTFPELEIGHTVTLALLSIKNTIGPKEFIKFIIEIAVRASHLGGEEVVAAALEAIPDSELTVEDVVMASLQAATNASNTRSSRNISAHDILGAAVAIASRLGSEVPVIIKEAFVAASSKLDPSMLRSSLLSVLGCAVGMGMTSDDIEDLMKAFSKEVKFGALGQRAAEDPNSSQSQTLQQPQAIPGSPGRGAATNPAKRSAVDEDDDGTDEARPSKKIKTESEDREDVGE